MGLLKKIFIGNPFGSITIGSVLSTLGLFVWTHFDPSKLTTTGLAAYGVCATIVGALTHHTIGTPTPKE